MSDLSMFFNSVVNRSWPSRTCFDSKACEHFSHLQIVIRKNFWRFGIQALKILPNSKSYSFVFNRGEIFPIWNSYLFVYTRGGIKCHGSLETQKARPKLNVTREVILCENFVATIPVFKVWKIKFRKNIYITFF